MGYATSGEVAEKCYFEDIIHHPWNVMVTGGDSWPWNTEDTTSVFKQDQKEDTEHYTLTSFTLISGYDRETDSPEISFQIHKDHGGHWK